MPDPRIRSPRLRVLLEQPDTDDLAEYTVQTDNRDMVRWDRYHAQRKWPSAQDGPMLWTQFLAWSALGRGGVKIGDGTYDAFEAVCVSTVAVNAEGHELTAAAAAEGGDPADPTQ